MYKNCLLLWEILQVSFKVIIGMLLASLTLSVSHSFLLLESLFGSHNFNYKLFNHSPDFLTKTMLSRDIVHRLKFMAWLSEFHFEYSYSV